MWAHFNPKSLSLEVGVGSPVAIRNMNFSIRGKDVVQLILVSVHSGC